MKIGNSLKQLRKEQSLTQKELAEKVGLSHTYISEIENNARRPSLDIINKISQGLNVPFFYLVLKSLEDTELKDPKNSSYFEEVKKMIDASMI